MQLKFLGTAAAEGWPAIFCQCEACKTARQRGGRNIRTRSQSIVDRRLLIDMPADTYMHVLQNNLDFSKVEHVLVTHSHPDHLYPEEFLLRRTDFVHLMDSVPKLYIYGNQAVTEQLKKAMAACDAPDSTLAGVLEPVEVALFTPFRAGEYTVTALACDHMAGLETAHIYLIEKDGKTLLYAHDTGELLEATWEYLAGRHVDAVSFDCTFVAKDCKRGHMGLPNAVFMKERMLEQGIADRKTCFAVNHFSHNGGMCYEEFAPLAEKHGFTVSYDGLEIEF